MKKPGFFVLYFGHLIFLASIFFINFTSRIIMAPLMPTIEGDLGISHGQAGSLFFLISVGYFTTLTASGFFSSRLTHSKTIVLSAVSLGLALVVTSLSHSLWGLRLGLLALGMAAGMYIPSAIATITSLIDSRHWGKAVAVHELAPNLSFVAAPLISEALIDILSWRGVLTALGIVSVVLGSSFALFGKGGGFRGQAPSLGAIRTLRSERSFWIMIILFSLAISSTLGVYTMLPLYLVSEHGIARNWANTLISLSRVFGLGTAFVGGWAADRLGPSRTIAGVLLLTGAMTIFLGATEAPLVILFVFLQPMIAVCFFPPAFSALSSIGPESIRNVAVSFTIPPAFMLGGGLVPTVIGLMGDAGYFGLGISLVGALILSGALLSTRLKLNL